MKKVLYIEDEKDVFEMVEMYSEDMGIEMVGVHNVTDARKAFVSDNYDLVICDINLGEKISGIDLYNEFTEMEKDIPFIFASTHIEEVNVMNASSNLTFIQKPFGEQVFRLVVSGMLNI
jgi:DNA-binding NtrC family response regulator